jgi:hypothetical protein
MTFVRIAVFGNKLEAAKTSNKKKRRIGTRPPNVPVPDSDVTNSITVPTSIRQAWMTDNREVEPVKRSSGIEQ